MSGRDTNEPWSSVSPGRQADILNSEIGTPTDADLAAIAALTTTSYGRSLLTLADQAALQTAVGASTASAVADPVADVLGVPTTAYEFETTSLTGLTAFGVADAEDAHTTIPGHYFIRASGAGAAGRYAVVAAPFTAVTRLDGRTHKAVDGVKVGLFISDSAPAINADTTSIEIGNAAVGGAVWVGVPGVSNLSDGTNQGKVGFPVYFAVRANSTSDVDFLYSMDGQLWTKVIDSRDPSITVATVGLIVYPSSALLAASFGFLRIWNSAKAFPGAVA